MTEDELTIPDVLADNQKNFCNVLTDDNDENEAFSCVIHDSLYYTESELVDMIRNRDIRNSHNLTILSINIANLLTKLRSLKLFISNISTPDNRPDIIIVVES